MGVTESKHQGVTSLLVAPKVVLTVCFEGTGNELDPPTTQIGLFAAAIDGKDVTHEKVPSGLPTPLHLKMAFDGCAVTDGMPGLLFAVGLRRQAKVVSDKIREVLKFYNGPVRCNVLGQSRGGIAGIFVAQALADLPASHVEVNMILFDPVPGDLVWSGFPFTGHYAKDLTRCTNLRRVLALYPHEPLPDLALHAPLLCAYPPDCKVEEDVTLGCHQAALCPPQESRSNNPNIQASNLSFRRIAAFLSEVGTKVRYSPYFYYTPTERDCLVICNAALSIDKPTRRSVHDGLRKGRTIFRRSKGHFLNKFHEQLLKGSCDYDRANMPKYLLDIE